MPIHKLKEPPRCLNRYCNVYQLLCAFKARSSTAPEAARRIGMPIRTAESAAARLRQSKYIEHIPDEGYHITELGRQALFNTPLIYAPERPYRPRREKLVRRLQEVKGDEAKRILIKDILSRLVSEHKPTFCKARMEAMEILSTKRTVRMTSADVNAALKLWLKQRYKVESQLEIDFTEDTRHPILVTAVLTEKD